MLRVVEDKVTGYRRFYTRPLSPETKAALVRAMVALYEVEAQLLAEPLELCAQEYSTAYTAGVREQGGQGRYGAAFRAVSGMRDQIEALARLGEVEVYEDAAILLGWVPSPKPTNP